MRNEPHVPVLTELCRVEEYLYSDADVTRRWLVAVSLCFEEGILLLEVDPGSDQVEMTLGADPVLRHWVGEVDVRDVSTTPEWSRLMGASAAWRWMLTNQQGYTDGAQVEFTVDSDTTTLQWIAQGSSLATATVTPVESLNG